MRARRRYPCITADKPRTIYAASTGNDLNVAPSKAQRMTHTPSYPRMQPPDAAGGGAHALSSIRPPTRHGLAALALAVAIASAAIYPLKAIAPAVSLSVVYLPAVLLVSAYWGLWLGLLASLLSAAAFNFFYLPPVGRFTIYDSRNWVALAAFVIVAAAVSTIADLARSRAVEAERRRAEADLAATLARELLAGERADATLHATARRISEALSLPSAAIELGTVGPRERQTVFPLYGWEGEQIASLLVPRSLTTETNARLRDHVVPTLQALLTIALHRDALQAEAIETAALRRSDEIKTALLRSVSHDLRTPLTAIVAAGHALGAASLTQAEREQLSAAIVDEGDQLSALIDKLLDLSRLQAGRAAPREDWISIDEIVHAARESLPQAAQQAVRISIDPDLPALQGDAGQLQQVFTNLLENACRYSDGRPVLVRARPSAGRVLIRVVDQGVGIPRQDQERIFEPFYRGSRQDGGRGSGLGLAIAKGFVEANHGRIWVESLPGQGSSFVVELPLPDRQPVQA